MDWAEIVFVMERSQRTRIGSRFRAQLNGKRIVCLDIADTYKFMEPTLVRLLEAKVGPHLRSRGG